MEKEIATHFSILVWRLPETEEPGGLQSMGHKELVPGIFIILIQVFI